MSGRLPESFFARCTVKVARDLVGFWLEHAGCGGRVVETEAYLGEQDPASHAYTGASQRNRAMFGAVGRAYVYRSYGIHHCLNVVAHPPGSAGAVLLRAIEPQSCLELMRQRRGDRSPLQLCNGPGKLCQALAIDQRHYDADMLGDPQLFLSRRRLRKGERVIAGPRVGISKAMDLPYRFWLENNPHVSRFRRGGKRR